MFPVPKYVGTRSANINISCCRHPSQVCRFYYHGDAYSFYLESVAVDEKEFIAPFRVGSVWTFATHSYKPPTGGLVDLCQRQSAVLALNFNNLKLPYSICIGVTEVQNEWKERTEGIHKITT